MEWFKRWTNRWRSPHTEPRASESTSPLDNLETAEERMQRWTSIWIIYFTMFLMSLGFGIVLTGVWPYLDKLDPHAGKEFMGLVVSANPLGQMLFAPLVGWWANKSGIRMPLLSTLALFVVSSAMYSCLHLYEENKKWWMLWSRFLVGVSSANIAAARSYVSAATRLSERTQAVSAVSLAQVLGFVVGPAIQAAMTPLGSEGTDYGPIRMDMYTAAGWFNVALGVVNFLLFLPCFFKEKNIAAREAMVSCGKKTEKEAWKAMKPDYISSWTLILAFFVLVGNFVLLETLATSLTMDQFAWTNKDALKNMGILMSVGAVVACLSFAVIGPLTKIFEERCMLLWGAFMMTGLASIFCIPWGPDPPILSVVPANWTGGELPPGCPTTQSWCKDTPAMTLTQFLIAYLLVSVGYPLGVTLIQTILSKILGPRPQGVWMGLLTGTGSLSRVVGPIYVSYIYSRKGPIWTFASTSIMMALSMVWIRLVYHRLLPPEGSFTIETEALNGSVKNVEMQVLNGTLKSAPNNNEEAEIRNSIGRSMELC